ncbi:hypothetical protein ACJMK2_038628, partial [Sinanodonta woodiana]
ECYGPGHSAGKRVDFFNVLACSRCCGNELQNAGLSVADMECNTNLCGIKPGAATIRPTTTLTCRSCHNAATLNDCIGHVTCKHNE